MRPLSTYRTIGDLPERVPVFPLRGVILLPRAELPLQIFEPRYLAMVDDALAGDRIIGMIQPDETEEPIESPAGRDVAMKRIGGIGRITAFRELGDGRLHIVLTGISRFTITEEARTVKPYRLADVRYDVFARDLGPDASGEQLDREELSKVLKLYLSARKLEIDWTMVAKAPLEPLVNGLAMMCPFGPEEKQALLEADNLAARADVLMTLAKMSVAGGDTGSGRTLQ